jgi:hypothetical protein
MSKGSGGIEEVALSIAIGKTMLPMIKDGRRKWPRPG